MDKLKTNTRNELMPPIFIGGTGRSGTTILIRLLSKHPEIFTIKWESQFLVANNGLIDLVHSPKGKLKQKYAKFKKTMNTHWYERVSNKGKPNEYSAGLIEDVSRRQLEQFYELLESYIAGEFELNNPKLIRGLVNVLFVPPTRAAGALRWCEKTPSNLLAIHELYRIYPNMKFINIIRDARDVISSIVARKFWPVAANKNFPQTHDFKDKQTPELVARYWSTLLEIGDKLAETIPKENYLELRLEDLVNNQDETIRRVFSFLGHTPTEEILNFSLNRANEGRWQNDLSEEDLKKINPIIAPMMAKKGYYL